MKKLINRPDAVVEEMVQGLVAAGRVMDDMPPQNPVQIRSAGAPSPIQRMNGTSVSVTVRM